MATFCQGAGISKVVLVTEGSSAAVFLFLSGLTPLTLTYIFEPVTAFLLLSVTVVALLTVFQFAFVSSKVSDFERTTYWYCCFEVAFFFPFLFSFFDFFLSPAAHPQVLTHLVLQLLRLDRLYYIIAEA